jgi:hypothetical protein
MQTKSLDALLEKLLTKEEIEEINKQAEVEIAIIRAAYKRKAAKAFALKKRRLHPLRRKKHE